MIILKQGNKTAIIGHQLVERYNDSKFIVYYDHGDKKMDKANVCEPTPYNKIKSDENTLSNIDIAIVEKKENKLRILIEIEESQAEPKKIIGDMMNIILADHILIKKIPYNLIVEPHFILGVIVNNKEGASEKKIRWVSNEILNILKQINREQYIFHLIIVNDFISLKTKVEEKVDKILHC